MLLHRSASLLLPDLSRFFLFCWVCFLVVCMDFRIAVGAEIDSHHAWTCINLSHLLNWHSKSPRFDSSFHFLGLFPEQEQTCNWGRKRVLTRTRGGVTFLTAVLLGCPCPPLVKSCWCRGCTCQTDVVPGDRQGSRL